MAATADVVVIGGGIHGASAAYALAARGVARVVLVEKGALASGASGRSSALVRLHYYFHCPKAFRRSELWTPARWPAPDALPSMACVLYDQVGGDGKTLEAYQRESEDGLRRTLY